MYRNTKTNEEKSVSIFRCTPYSLELNAFCLALSTENGYNVFKLEKNGLDVIPNGFQNYSSSVFNKSMPFPQAGGISTFFLAPSKLAIQIINHQKKIQYFYLSRFLKIANQFPIDNIKVANQAFILHHRYCKRDSRINYYNARPHKQKISTILKNLDLIGHASFSQYACYLLAVYMKVILAVFCCYQIFRLLHPLIATMLAWAFLKSTRSSIINRQFSQATVMFIYYPLKISLLLITRRYSSLHRVAFSYLNKYMIWRATTVQSYFASDRKEVEQFHKSKYLEHFKDLTCPLTGKPILYPVSVMIGRTKVTFERYAIKTYVANCGRLPSSQRPIALRHLRLDKPLYHQIKAKLQKLNTAKPA